MTMGQRIDCFNNGFGSSRPMIMLFWVALNLLLCTSCNALGEELESHGKSNHTAGFLRGGFGDFGHDNNKVQIPSSRILDGSMTTDVSDN